MDDVMPSPVQVEVAGGFVDSTERSRAREMVASVCSRSRRARGRVILYARMDSPGSATASADAILVLDDYRLLCAGAVAASTHEAIERLETRLRRQVVELGERDNALHKFIRHGANEPLPRRRPEPARM
jgi:hypothetical protein